MVLALLFVSTSAHMDSYEIKEVTLVWTVSNTDGNALFDTICVSEDVPLVERSINGHQWYKHFYPTIRVDEVLEGNNALAITFVIPVIRDDNKRVSARAYFDFNSGIMKIKHVSSYAISVAQLVSIISTTIHIDISQDIKVTSIELSVDIAGEKPDLELLCDMVMNEPRLSEIFSLKEKITPISMKVKYSIYTKLGILTFRRGESKTLVISSIKEEEHINIIVSQALLLLHVYDEVKNEFRKLYSVVAEEDKTSMHRTRTFALKEEVPELFVSGYARECSIKPIIITELEEEKYKSEGRPTMRYPKDGPYSRIYACDVGLFPGLRKNRLYNKDMFEFLPCCYATNHLDRPESNYYKYTYDIFDESRRNKKVMRFKPLYPLEAGVAGRAPKELQEMVCSTDLTRVGVNRSRSSILQCMPYYISRKDLSFPPFICLQELWYLTEKEILLNARDSNVFLDPTLYCRALEHIFSINIYVIDILDDTSIRLSIPHVKGPYIWEHEYDQSVIILCYRNVLPYPQCELVTGNWSNALRQFKAQLTACADASKPKEFIRQKIDANGKCISVLTRNGWTPCLWRPLSIERTEADEPSHSVLVHAQRLRAYFVHDLYLMCKQWNVINVEIVRSNVVFTPKIMREIFSTADEFIHYYSSKYPLLFGRGVLRVTQRTYTRLKRCHEGPAILPLIISPTEFTRRRNNMITIMRSSGDECVEVDTNN